MERLLSVHEHGGQVSTKAGRYQEMLGWLGRVFADRYYAHELKTPTEIVFAVNYVLNNPERHGASRPERGVISVDSFTSVGAGTDDMPRPDLPLVARPKGVLLSKACRAQLRQLGL